MFVYLINTLNSSRGKMIKHTDRMQSGPGALVLEKGLRVLETSSTDSRAREWTQEN